MKKALITGLATGAALATIARAIRHELGGNLVRALTISRTEVLRSYRESSRRFYEANSDVVKGRIWRSALGRRTCAACWAMHGTFHKTTERLDGHPRCGCAMVPVTKNWAELGFKGVQETRTTQELGTDLFARLKPEEQLAILGPAKFAAYQDGVISLEDLVGRRRSREWGTMRYERSLAEVLGREASQRLIRRARGERQELRSVGAMVSLQMARLSQLGQMHDDAIDGIIGAVKQATALPRLDYHFQRHGVEFGAASAADYLQAMRQHLTRSDLRVFSFLRPEGQVPFWALVAPDTGATVLYNEGRRRLYSFYRPDDPAVRMAAVQTHWIELVRDTQGWQKEAYWQWRP